MIVEIKKLDEEVNIPEYKTIGSSGMDIEAFSFHNKLLSMVLYPGSISKIGTGLAMSIPRGYEGQVRSRSGLSSAGIVVANSPGTLDSDFRGEVCVLLANISEMPVVINRGDRIAQIVFSPIARATIEVVDKLNETSRGSGAFGSTGV